MPSEEVYVPISVTILVVVEEIKSYLETQLLIQATQPDMLENTIFALRTQHITKSYKKRILLLLSNRVL